MPYHQKQLQQHTVDQHSLCLHRCIAEKLLKHPHLLASIQEKLHQRHTLGMMKYGAFIHWQSVLDVYADPALFVATMTATDKVSINYRRQTIFTGILNEKERSDCLAALIKQT